MAETVVVAHHYWGRAGGEQLLSASAAHAFSRLGFRVVIASPTRVRLEVYPRAFGLDISRFERYELLPVSVGALGLYLRLLLPYVARRAAERYSARIVFIDSPTYKPLLGCRRRLGLAIVEYIHFPLEASFTQRLPELHYKRDPHMAERYSRFPMNLYLGLYARLLPRLLRGNPFEAADLVLANSRWTARIVERLYGEEPLVLNPPIPPSVEVLDKPPAFEERRPSIVMLGRFSEEKRYHWVVSELAPRLLREAPEARLYIVGATGTRSSRAYYERVWRLAERAGLRVAGAPHADAQVYLIADAPRTLINRLMDSSRALLHATINEHWGIVVAEALARGLPPVVHRSGGAWTDLVEEGRHGLGYETAEEAVEALARLLTDPRLFSSLSRRGPEKARSLTLEAFTEKLGRLLGEKGLL